MAQLGIGEIVDVGHTVSFVYTSHCYYFYEIVLDSCIRDRS